MRLLNLIRHAYRRAMPAPRDPFKITPEQLEVICDQSLEDHNGKPIDRGALALNLAAAQRRLVVQEEEGST